MTELLVVIDLVAVWVLAVRYGHDSRDVARSKEQDLASYGIVWDDLIDPQALPFLARERRTELLGHHHHARTEPDGEPRSPLRAGLARRLRSFADRLEPDRSAGHAHA